MPKTAKQPSYLLHKPTGQARVRVNGRDHYLGEYGSPESRERYDDLVAEWFGKQGNVDAVSLTVDGLVIQYLAFAAEHYQKNGKPTSELSCVRIAMRHLVAVAGTTRARAFGPLALKRVRQRMIDAGVCRESISIHVGRIRRAFRWATENELLPVAVYQALATVGGLRQGRSAAKESAPVRPVSEAVVDAVVPHLSTPVAAMLRLQMLSGMRPGEVVLMRGCDLNMAGKVWEYVPASHKTEHHGRRRVVFLGLRAQAIVREFLKPDLTAYLFSPADGRREFDERRREARQTPLTPSQAARTKRRKPKRTPGKRYTVPSYGHAIRKGCERAFDMPKELRNVSTTIKGPDGKVRRLTPAERKDMRRRAREWREEHCFHPHQARHSAATAIRREFGLDTTRTVLGHSSMAVAEIYAEADFDKAREAAAKPG